MKEHDPAIFRYNGFSRSSTCCSNDIASLQRFGITCTTSVVSAVSSAQTAAKRKNRGVKFTWNSSASLVNQVVGFGTITVLI